MRLVRLLSALALLGSFCAAAAQSAAERERALGERLLAPCCYSEPLTRHRSETAQKAQAELRELIAAGKSDAEIIAQFKQQYGARVLIEPEGGLSGVAYTVPIAAALLGGAGVVWLLWRWARPAAENA